MWEKGTVVYCWWECKLVQPLWKNTWRLFKNLNIDLPYDPGIPLLGIYPKQCDSGYSRGPYTPMFMVALLTIAKLWKQLRSFLIYHVLTIHSSFWNIWAIYKAWLLKTILQYT
jgi:hypothetical protein